MVEIRIYRNSGGNIIGFTVGGHANIARSGKDIVCAGISSLTQAAALGLQKHLNKKIVGHAELGRLKVVLAEEPDACTNAILETMLLGLQEIEVLYKKNVHILQEQDKSIAEII